MLKYTANMCIIVPHSAVICNDFINTLSQMDQMPHVWVKRPLIVSSSTVVILAFHHFSNNNISTLEGASRNFDKSF